MKNPRFPHQCKVYRREEATSFNPEGKLVTLYEGECRKSASNNIRTFNTGSNATGKVDVADYRISVPGVVKGVKKGDLIDVTDLIGTEKELRIVLLNATQLGGGGTEFICNSPSN